MQDGTDTLGNIDVSVVIPAYNAARFLGEAIESVLRQTAAPDEVVVVDDGSTDDTLEVARRFAPRVRCLRQANGGPAAARNNGVRHCRGELIAFQDADDLWLPTKLATQLRYLEAHPEFAAVYTDLSEVDSDGSMLVRSKFNTAPGAGSEGSILEAILLCGFMFMQTVLVERSVFLDIGYFDEALSPSDDRDFAIRMATRFRIGCVPEALTQRRRHDANISNSFMNRGMRTDILAIEKSLRLIDMDDQLRARVRSHLGQLHLRLGRFDLAQGDRLRARRALLRAVRLDGGVKAMGLLPLTFAPRRLLAAGARFRRMVQRGAPAELAR